MTKMEFVNALAEGAGLTKKDAKIVAATIQDIIYNHIKDEDGLRLAEGIVFRTRYKEAHNGRNPSNGETIEIGARYVPCCKFGKKVKDFINQ